MAIASNRFPYALSLNNPLRVSVKFSTNARELYFLQDQRQQNVNAASAVVARNETIALPLQEPENHLHIRIIWAFTALRHSPRDVLRGILDIAGFAMHTVLVVDLKPRGMAF